MVSLCLAIENEWLLSSSPNASITEEGRQFSVPEQSNLFVQVIQFIRLVSFRLVVDANVDILLPRRKDMVFLLTRQVGQLFQRLTDDLETLRDLLFCDDQWWCETDDVLMCGFGLTVKIS